jgi:hypothetical protein
MQANNRRKWIPTSLDTPPPSSTQSAPLPPPPPPVIVNQHINTGVNLGDIIRQRNKKAEPIQVFVPRLLEDDPNRTPLRFVVMSDTHNYHDLKTIPDGDVLLHCGDMSNHGGLKYEIAPFNEFLGKLKHRYKVVICGNHEQGIFAKYGADTDRIHNECFPNATHVLLDNFVVIEGIKIYGSPWVPLLLRDQRDTSDGSGWYRGNQQLQEKWALIPDDVHVLMTHAPPYGVLDGEHGCKELIKVLPNLKQLRVHTFGHVSAA